MKSRVLLRRLNQGGIAARGLVFVRRGNRIVPVKNNYFSLTGSLLAVLIAGCSPADEDALPPRPVKAVKADTTASVGHLGFNAQVVSHRETPLAFQVNGKVVARHVDSGDRVKTGQQLLSLDTADFELSVERFQAEIKVAEAEQKTAKTDLERFRQLQAEKFVSPTALDQASNRFNASTGRLRAAQAQLALAKRQLEYTALVASYDGWIDEVRAEPGQVIAAGEPLGRLNSDRLEVVFGLPEQYIDKVEVGDSLSASFWSCEECSTTVKVREVGAAARSTTGTLAVRAELTASIGKLRPGMSAWVEMGLGLPADAVVIPQIAVVQLGGLPAVWVVNTENQPQTTGIRQVSLDAMVGDKVLVTEGLVAGDWVVTAGQHVLSEHQPVRILD